MSAVEAGGSRGRRLSSLLAAVAAVGLAVSVAGCGANHANSVAHSSPAPRDSAGDERQRLCWGAMRYEYTGWSTIPEYAGLVAEAKKQGLTVDQCRRILDLPATYTNVRTPSAATPTTVATNGAQPTAAPKSPSPPSYTPQKPTPTYGTVSLVKEGGTFKVPVVINGSLVLNFVVDSGASDVSIPADVVLVLTRTGTLQQSDFFGTTTYRLADGSTMPSQNFRIRSLKVGDRTIENVIGSTSKVEGSLLLGQSFLSRFSRVSFDYNRQVLVLE